MYNNYNRKNKVGDIKFVPIVTTDPITSLIATGIASGVSSLFASLKHPVKDSRKRIEIGKSQISTMDARTRLASIISINNQNNQTMDVSIPEWLLWYRKNYPNDFQQLLPEDLIYWNSYLDSVYNNYNIANFPKLVDLLNQSYFTKSELDYSKQLSSPSTTTKKAGMNIFLTIALVGAGLFLLLKRKKA